MLLGVINTGQWSKRAAGVTQYPLDGRTGQHRSHDGSNCRTMPKEMWITSE